MNTKQVIIIRKDLKMRKGKMVAQGAHASMKVFLDLMVDHRIGDINVKSLPLNDVFEDWFNGIFTKIVVGVDSEKDLKHLYTLARIENLPCSLIKDCGLTEFDGVPTYTAVAVGPADAEHVDKITKELKLL